MKKVLAVLALAAGLFGAAIAAAPSASAVPVHLNAGLDGDVPNDDTCIVIHINLRGTVIGTGPSGICIPH
jgi:hypothetical protein